jgi:hypothetical protein
MVEMTANDKHYNLLRHKINYVRKKIYDSGQSCESFVTLTLRQIKL